MYQLNLCRYEPLSYMLGKEYFLHAYGPISALSAEVVARFVALKNSRQAHFLYYYKHLTNLSIIICFFEWLPFIKTLFFWLKKQNLIFELDCVGYWLDCLVYHNEIFIWSLQLKYLPMQFKVLWSWWYASLLEYTQYSYFRYLHRGLILNSLEGVTESWCHISSLFLTTHVSWWGQWE